MVTTIMMLGPGDMCRRFFSCTTQNLIHHQPPGTQYYHRISCETPERSLLLSYRAASIYNMDMKMNYERSWLWFGQR